MRTTVLLLVAVLLGLGAGTLIEHGSRQATLIDGGLLVLLGLPLVALARHQLGDAYREYRRRTWW
jgi:hypothetical protein